MKRSDDQKSWGAHVKRMRRAKGLTQEELAAATGMSDDMIGSIEQGRAWTSLSNLHMLAEALGVRVPDLFEVKASRAAARKGASRTEVSAQLEKLISGLSPTSQKAVLDLARRLRQIERR